MERYFQPFQDLSDHDLENGGDSAAHTVVFEVSGQGSAFMPHATEWLDTIDEAQAENIFTREQLLRYFPYYLLVNSTFAVTAALGAAGLDSEANLMARVRTLLAEVRDQVTHKTCLNYVLESPYWNVKGNFFCYLNDHNENTIVDPSVIYFDFANPLQAQEV